MATIKVKFRLSTIDGKEGTIFYKIIHKRVAKQTSNNHKLYPSEWDNIKGKVIIKPDIANERKVYLNHLQGQILADLSAIAQIVKTLEKSGTDFTSSDIVKMFLDPNRGIGFIAYARKLIAKLKAIGKPVAANHQYALNSFIKFHGNEEVAFEDFTPNLIMAYECYLKDKVCRNSSSCYMRNLHAIYNKAVEDGLAPADTNPFRHVYTGVDKTEKRAINLKLIQSIADADFTLNPSLDLARDMFMFSFITQGMSFVDIAHLQDKNINDGTLTYRRSKTGQTIKMKYADEIKVIVDKYKDKRTPPYLLPLLSSTDKKDSQKEYDAVRQRINSNIKKVGKKLDLPVKLTMYVARHSWASIAQAQHVPTATISRCLGHDSEQSTAIYLAKIETSETDKANDIVLRALKSGKKEKIDNDICVTKSRLSSRRKI